MSVLVNSSFMMFVLLLGVDESPAPQKLWSQEIDGIIFTLYAVQAATEPESLRTGRSTTSFWIEGGRRGEEAKCIWSRLALNTRPVAAACLRDDGVLGLAILTTLSTGISDYVLVDTVDLRSRFSEPPESCAINPSEPSARDLRRANAKSFHPWNLISTRFAGMFRGYGRYVPRPHRLTFADNVWKVTMCVGDVAFDFTQHERGWEVTLGAPDACRDASSLQDKEPVPSRLPTPDGAPASTGFEKGFNSRAGEKGQP